MWDWRPSWVLDIYYLNTHPLLQRMNACYLSNDDIIKCMIDRQSTFHFSGFLVDFLDYNILNTPFTRNLDMKLEGSL